MPTDDFTNRWPVKLVISAEERSIGPYLTLSHRWGSAKLLKLTSANLEEMRREIPMSQLSKTFKDAIVVARTFGVKYLWIDSLCILQDSKEDWTKEVVTMCDVYRNSYCNLAAMSSENRFEGLFYERNGSMLATHSVALRKPGGGTAIYNLTIDCLLRKDEVQYAPLRNRGWVLQ